MPKNYAVIVNINQAMTLPTKRHDDRLH